MNPFIVTLLGAFLGAILGSVAVDAWYWWRRHYQAQHQRSGWDMEDREGFDGE